MSEQVSYKTIFKTTFLFSFVKIFQILAGIIKNKFVDILLGAEGVGIIGILSNSVSLLQQVAGLGISQSAVKDISEANVLNDKKRFSRTITLTNRVILFTCLLGCFIAIMFSPLLSKWTFGDKSYTIAYIGMALVVGLNILTEGQLAILKGMRQLRALAKASMIGSVVGLITSVPMYYFFGKEGIVPSLIITAFSAFFFSNYFVREIRYEKLLISLKDILNEVSPMVKMGIALMFVGFLTLLSDLIIVAYIRSHGGLKIVGLYRAGTAIIISYFGIILNAMETDYYPRISAVNKDNNKLQEEVNRQSEVGLVFIFPISVIFVFLSPLIFKLLYSKEFIQSIVYTDFAILGIIIVVCSNCMGMIFLAKQAVKIFTLYSFIHRTLFLPIYIILYNYQGILGLGVAYILNTATQLVIYSIISWYKYNIRLNKKLLITFLSIFGIVFINIYLKKNDNIYLRNSFGLISIFISSLYFHFKAKKVINLNILSYFKVR